MIISNETPISGVTIDMVDTVDFMIDEHLRIVRTPNGRTTLGVESDCAVNMLKFQISKKYHGIDLTEFSEYRVVFVNTNGDAGVTVIDKCYVVDNYIEFVWLVPSLATMFSGLTQIAISLIKLNDVGSIIHKFNTTISEFNVLGTLLPEAYVPEGDLHDYFWNAVNNIAKPTVEQWLRSHDSVSSLRFVNFEKHATIYSNGVNVLESIIEGPTEFDETASLAHLSVAVDNGELDSMMAFVAIGKTEIQKNDTSESGKNLFKVTTRIYNTTNTLGENYAVPIRVVAYYTLAFTTQDYVNDVVDRVFTLESKSDTFSRNIADLYHRIEALENK